MVTPVVVQNSRKQVVKWAKALMWFSRIAEGATIIGSVAQMQMLVVCMHTNDVTRGQQSSRRSEKFSILTSLTSVLSQISSKLQSTAQYWFIWATRMTKFLTVVALETLSGNSALFSWQKRFQYTLQLFCYIKCISWLITFIITVI